MTDISFFEHEVMTNGLGGYFYPSFEAAKASGKEYSLVYLPNAQTGYFDVYLTAIKNGVFGEYVCWVEDEFKEDDELIYTVLEYIKGAYSEGDVGENLHNMNPLIHFKSYDSLNDQ